MFGCLQQFVFICWDVGNLQNKSELVGFRTSSQSFLFLNFCGIMENCLFGQRAFAAYSNMQS